MIFTPWAEFKHIQSFCYNHLAHGRKIIDYSILKIKTFQPKSSNIFEITIFF